MAKVLQINYQKCTGCRLCELVCAVAHDGKSNPARSRIKVMKWEAEGLYVPMSCNHCQDAPCMNACPVKAIYRDEELGRVMVDYDVCIGCRTCVAVCPFGAMSYNTKDKKVFKCDFCDGDPQCVRFCEVQAIEYVDAEEVSIEKKREAAERLSVAGKEAAVLFGQL
ncbi:MAG: 4Fe-4S dicluster domain-containing protein [Deltaproteobacteria bacterium]|nr:4Fe-4S dicluster domain-containing protein [Deltaproteobacteria bacterium]MBW2017322.1 4Fe-4S dicluster domain-containing protein [Deltaproteobacteria bacterium]MBW2129991.1 4Fe-4S dicluster domain-containing protein [Deltaproteobacteria bacterium]MBW2304632.1 4Fe-4S dicluster domain-containing protein [Deltaproteobacteria bacterium]